jgi:hypothetical protein
MDWLSAFGRSVARLFSGFEDGAPRGSHTNGEESTASQSASSGNEAPVDIPALINQVNADSRLARPPRPPQIPTSAAPLPAVPCEPLALREGKLRPEEICAINAALSDEETLKQILRELPGVDPDDPRFGRFYKSHQ